MAPSEPAVSRGHDATANKTNHMANCRREYLHRLQLFARSHAQLSTSPKRCDVNHASRGQLRLSSSMVL